MLTIFQLKRYGAGKGAWAIVTGASDGIGAEYARQLASKKFNILLISRTAAKLDALSTEIAAKYHVETKQYAMDCSLNREEDFEQLEKLFEVHDVIPINTANSNRIYPFECWSIMSVYPIRFQHHSSSQRSMSWSK